jgi:hypothetical protein
MNYSGAREHYFIFVGNDNNLRIASQKSIDDVLIYNRSMSAAEVNNLYLFTKGVPVFSVALNSPSNNLQTTNNQTTFSCSASYNTTISSIALYGNWSGTWRVEQTSSGSSLNSTKTLPIGTYKWNCLGTADTGETAWASSNYTLTINSPPTPINGQCGPTLNSCISAGATNTGQNSTHYTWTCPGSNGGSNASCSQLIPVSPSYHPTDRDGDMKLNGSEISLYNVYFKFSYNWFDGSGKINSSYINNANIIFKFGPAYTYNSSRVAPSCWLP